MHDALKELLRKAVPRMVGATVLVSDELLEGGHDAAFAKYLSKNLSAKLADFIVESKVLDGADESCFSMVPDEKLAATRCEARLHVLTPQELETLVTQAFVLGQSVARKHAGDIVAVKPFEYAAVPGGPDPYEVYKARQKAKKEWDEAPYKAAAKAESEKLKKQYYDIFGHPKGPPR